ncbi:hypothetical protein CCACVL1_01197, partial [Corchorus capsularis]
MAVWLAGGRKFGSFTGYRSCIQSLVSLSLSAYFNRISCKPGESHPPSTKPERTHAPRPHSQLSTNQPYD